MAPQEINDLKFWVDVAQIVTTILTLATLIGTLWFSRKSIKEIAKDRIFSQRPYLLFEYDNIQCDLKRKVNKDGKHYFSLSDRLKSDGVSVEYVPYGKLVNYGAGPAIEIEITWVIDYVEYDGEIIKKTPWMIKEWAQLAPAENIMTPIASHLLPNQETSLDQLPGFIRVDTDRKVKIAKGNMLIRYSDSFGHSYVTYQRVELTTLYFQTLDIITVKFKNILKPPAGEVVGI